MASVVSKRRELAALASITYITCITFITARDAGRVQCVIEYITTLTPTIYDRVENISKYHSP
jgi:hypothetical protein